MEPVTAMEVSVALVTVNVAVFDVTVPEVAVIIDVPAATPKTFPWFGVVLLIVAAAVLDEFQITVAVTSFVLPSANVPFAVKKVEVVGAIDIAAGVIAIDIKAGAGTVKVVDPLMVPDVAVIVVVPVALLIVNPPVLTVAIAVFEELHVTEPVKSWLGPLE